MEDLAFEFLRQLAETGAPSGYEQPVQELFALRATEAGAEVRRDVMGNAIATLNRGGSPRMMLAGHADEIGFLVTYITDEGFVYFAPVGGWDAEIAVGQRVTIHGAAGPVPGVIGKQAIHLMDADDRKKKSQIDKLWIDLGAGSRRAAQECVGIGDPVTIRVPLERLAGDRVASKALDNRMAVWICAETLRLLQGETFTAEVHSVSTVQEEIGLRGARTSAYGLAPEVGLALDVCHATDYPDANKHRVGDIRIGEGPVIARGANIHPRVYELLLRTAREEGIPFQVEAAPAGTGTDANAMQISQSGMATGLVSVALRYMHTPCELLSLTDLENAARLCAGFIQRLRPGMDWSN